MYNHIVTDDCTYLLLVPPGVPRLDPRVFKLPFVAANLGDTAVIHIPVIGEPTPSFQWYRVHGGVPGEPLAAKDQRGQSDK